MAAEGQETAAKGVCQSVCAAWLTLETHLKF
jgi:hypothetical protein